MKRIFLLPFFLAVIAPLAFGCASHKEETFADRVQAHGGVFSSIADSWQNGEKMAADGKKMIEEGGEKFKKGRALMEEGEADRAKGQEMMALGERKQQEAEMQYQEMRSVPQAALQFMHQ
ncbi:MAG: hypothetical protein ABW189_07425 [Rickettsiales bacterium]